jgi:hypothetical protein
MSNDTSKMKLTSPEILAHEIYDQALRDADGDEREASLIVMHFLTEALVYSAGLSVGGDEVLFKGVLEQLAGMIAKAPIHPIAAAVTHNRDARRTQAAKLVFHHEDDGGDGRYHVTTGTDACACGTPHGTDRHVIPGNDPQLGFSPPEAFCTVATNELSRVHGRKPSS